MRLGLLVLALAEVASTQRVLHWVIRVSSLEETVAFTTEVLGMKVLRHEENAEPCPLTCNGVFDTPWSKTMVGYSPEHRGYALELTYNYGISSYERGAGLQRFVLHINGARAALGRARARGLAVDGSAIIGPDGYTFELHEKGENEGLREPMRDVVLRAADALALAEWYEDVLGMSREPLDGGAQRLWFATRCASSGTADLWSIGHIS